VPRLWINGSLGFGPSAIYVRETKAIYLSSTWDEGVPDDIPRENLFGITFNGENTLRRLRAIPGAATARTVATDGLAMSTSRLLAACFPQAELVDAEVTLRQLRATKLPAEIDAIRRSVAVAEGALAVGRTERQLTGIFMQAMAAAGVTIPTTQDVAWISSRQDPWSRSSRDTAVARDDLVGFEAGVIAGGYVGELGRTHCLAGIDRALRRRWDRLWEALVAACRPGHSGTALLDAYTAAGVPAPPLPVARGLGLGNDLPLVTHGLPGLAAEQVLEPGMVLSLTAHVWQPGIGALSIHEPLLITDTGVELLSAHPFHDTEG
jgi:Xaa-Pro aminopeptidase